VVRRIDLVFRAGGPSAIPHHGPELVGTSEKIGPADSQCGFCPTCSPVRVAQNGKTDGRTNAAAPKTLKADGEQKWTGVDDAVG